jgi:hypothetical protein
MSLSSSLEKRFTGALESQQQKRENKMKNIKSVDYHQLQWKQKKWGGSDFELSSGDDRVGVLYWPKWLSDRAVVKSGDGNWIIDRVGFFRDRVIVIDVENGKEVAGVEFGWLGDAEVTLVNGKAYKWYRTGILSNNWIMADENDELVFEIKEWMHWFKHRADIVMRVGSITRPDLPLLIFLSWYLAFMQMQDAAAVVAATAAIS